MDGEDQYKSKLKYKWIACFEVPSAVMLERAALYVRLYGTKTKRLVEPVR